MLDRNCCQPGPTEVSINVSLMAEKEEHGEKGHMLPGVEDHLLVNELERLALSELIIMWCQTWLLASAKLDSL